MKKINNKSFIEPKKVPNYKRIWGFYIVLPIIALSIIGNILEYGNYMFILFFSVSIIFVLLVIPRFVKKNNKSNYSILFGFGSLLLVFLFEYNVLMYYYLQTLNIDKIYFILVLFSEIVIAILSVLHINIQINIDTQLKKKHIMRIVLLSVTILLAIILPVLFVNHDAQYGFVLFGVLYTSIIYLIVKMLTMAIIFKKMNN